MEALKHPILKELGTRFIMNEKGEPEEIVFKFSKFQELRKSKYKGLERRIEHIVNC